MKKKPNNEILIPPPNVMPYTDERTGVKTVAFPFTFKDGTRGMCCLTKLSKNEWKITNDIKSIQINYA